MSVYDNNKTRTVDCGGNDLAVVGSGDTLTVANCLGITVLGSKNRMQVQLMPYSTITAIGGHNHIVFRHTPGYEAQVRSTGAHNEIVPEQTTPRT